MNRKIVALLILIVLVATLAGGQEQSQKEEFYVAERIEPGSYGGSIIVAAQGDPKTFNVITANETSSSDVLNRMYSALVGLDNQTQVYTPALAKSWDVSEDNLQWTFHLRKGIRWSDGKPITADDVLFSLATIYDPAIPNSIKDMLKIDGKELKAEKIDDHTVKFTLPDIYGPFNYSIGALVILPKHALEGAVKAGTFAQTYDLSVKPADLVVNGPFTLEKFVSGEKVVLKKNPNFWSADKKGQRLPYLDNLIFLNVPDTNASLLKFQSGETDFYGFLGDKYRMLKDEEKKGNYTVHDLGPSMGTEHLWFNLNEGKNQETGKPYVDPVKLKWFQQRDFRRAVSHAINRPGIVRVVYRGRATPIYGAPSPANKRWSNPDIPKFTYDPKKAKALLDKLGYVDRDGDGIREDKEGNKISFTIVTNRENEYRTKVGNIIYDSLRKIGLDATMSLVEFNSLVVKLMDSYDYECCMLGLTGTLEPVGGMNTYLSSGRLHEWYPNQEEPATEAEARMDELMNKYVKSPGYEEQRAHFFEVQRIMAEEQFLIYTVSPNIYAAVRNKFGNVKPTPLRHRLLWNCEEIFAKRTR